MANGIPSTLKVMRAEIAAGNEHARREFNHIETALGDIMRDVALIKERLPVRKAGKVRRRGVPESSQT